MILHQMSIVLSIDNPPNSDAILTIQTPGADGPTEVSAFTNEVGDGSSCAILIPVIILSS